MSDTTTNPTNPTSVPSAASGPPSLEFEARWERPLVPTLGGAATLMIRITPVATPAAEARHP